MSRRAMILTATAIVLVAIAAAGAVRVPAGTAILLEPPNGGETVVLGPGWHWRRFGYHPVRYATEGHVAGQAAIPSGPAISWTLDVALDPPRLATLHQTMKGAPLDDFLHDQMNALLTRAAEQVRPAQCLGEDFRSRTATSIAESMQAAGFLRAEITLEPPDAQTLLDAALALAPAGDAWELRLPVAAALEAAPGDWRLHTALALVNESESLIAEAESGYLDALSIEPSAIPPMERLVSIYSTVGEWDRLQRILDAALTANPRSIQHINWTALVLIKKQDDTGAERILGDGLAIAPDNTTLLGNLGVLYMNTGREAEAVETFRRLVAADPDNTQALYNLGSALAATDQWDESLEYLDRAEKAGHVSLPLTETLAIVHAKLGHKDDAKRYREAAARMRASAPEARPAAPAAKRN